MTTKRQRHLVFTGVVIGAPSAYRLTEFDAAKPHTFCRLCGSVFQSAAQRASSRDTPALIAQRKAWSHSHALKHSKREHEQLAKSGRYATPEAAHKLAPLGVIFITDQLNYPDTNHAGLEAPREPYNTPVEGSTP